MAPDKVLQEAVVEPRGLARGKVDERVPVCVPHGVFGPGVDEALGHVQAALAECREDVTGRRLARAQVDLLEDLRRLLGVELGRHLPGLADARSKDAGRLVCELFLVRTGADNELDERQDDAHDEGACGLLLDERVE